MIFDNNIPYQTYRVLIAIFGTLGMIVATSRIKENKMKNRLIVCGYGHGRKFCVSDIRQSQKYHMINVHIWGLFPLVTAFLGGRGGMRAEGVNAVTASREPYPKGISPPCGQRTGCPSD